MLTAILAIVVLLMVGVLLAPTTANNILHFRVPTGLRPPASRLIFVPVISVFLFGTFMFDSMMSSVSKSSLLPADLVQHYLSLIVGVFLLLFGSLACLWPLRFMRMCVPRLRAVDEGSIDEQEMSALARVARGFGIIFLLGAAFLLRGWFM
jgi:hypothetical protein